MHPLPRHQKPLHLKQLPGPSQKATAMVDATIVVAVVAVVADVVDARSAKLRQSQ
jgi:hypothetical protein